MTDQQRSRVRTSDADLLDAVRDAVKRLESVSDHLRTLVEREDQERQSPSTRGMPHERGA